MNNNEYTLKVVFALQSFPQPFDDTFHILFETCLALWRCRIRLETLWVSHPLFVHHEHCLNINRSGSVALTILSFQFSLCNSIYDIEMF